MEGDMWGRAELPTLDHSLIHCVGDNFLPSAWIYRSCQYRNMCWDSKNQTFVLYRSPPQKALDEQNFHPYARFSTAFQADRIQVLPIGTSPRGAKDTGRSWVPHVIDSTIPSHTQHSPSVIIPIYATGPQSTLDLLFQVLLPLYNLLGIFGWQEETDVSVVLLNSSSLECDTTCRDWMRQGLRWMGYTLLDSPTSSFCTSRAAAGMGLLTASGLGQRGQNIKDYSHLRIHNAGRGALFWEFRHQILQHLQIHSAPHIERMETIQVAVADPIWYQHLRSVVNIPTISVTHVKPTVNDDATQWMREAAQSNVWIAVAHQDGAWPALFLPRGSTLILLYDEEQTPKGGATDHSVMPDFDLWNHMTHLQVHWLSIQHNPESLVSQILAPLIKDQRDKGYAVSETEGDDWTFNGLPVQLVYRSPLPSKVHCVGENWEWDASSSRSCHYQNLCFDTARRTFAVAPSDSQFAAQHLRPHDVVSTSLADKSVAMGQSVRIGAGTPWTPNQTKAELLPSRYYSLPSNVVWLPYYAEQPNVNNPGHLLWDYWFPLYTLLELFDLHETESTKLFLTNIDIRCVWYSPDPCYNITTKFLPLMGVDPSTLINSYNPRLRIPQGPESTWVCASQGVAGIGMLTDHGFKKHGQLLEDYQNVRNVGRGVAMWRFRRFLLRNMGLSRPSSMSILHWPPYKITVSINSSNNESRRRDFAKQIAMLQQRLPAGVVVQVVNLAKLKLAAQLQLMQETSIFLSVIGGSASTAMFMERSSCLILYYNDIDDFVPKTKGDTKMPNMMDWDFWNHASYMRVHWLPIQSMDEPNDLEVLFQLVQSEVERLPFVN